MPARVAEAAWETAETPGRSRWLGSIARQLPFGDLQAQTSTDGWGPDANPFSHQKRRSRRPKCWGSGLPSGTALAQNEKELTPDDLG
jgi:hypothetical protein